MVREWVKAIAVFFICIVIGCAAGLLYGLVIDEVRYSNVDPIDLAQSYKADYLQLIAADYVQDPDIDLARKRIEALGFEPQGVRLRAEQFVHEKRPAAWALAKLAVDMGLESEKLTEALVTATPEPTAIPSPTLSPTATASPTVTPTSIITATATAIDFVVSDMRMLTKKENGGCEGMNVVYVTVQDEAGELLDGVTVAMRGEEGEYRQVTGYDPRAPGQVAFPLEGRYILQVVEYNGQPVRSERSGEITSHSPSVEDLVSAGYCSDIANCESKRQERPQALCDGSYSWDVLFQRTGR